MHASSFSSITFHLEGIANLDSSKRIITNHASPKKTGICAWFWNVRIRTIEAGITIGFLLYSICSVTATSKMSSFPNRCKSRDTYLPWEHLNKQERKLSQKTQRSATEKAYETIHPVLCSCILKPSWKVCVYPVQGH